MNWNYRILARTLRPLDIPPWDLDDSNDIIEFGVYEVYYENDIPTSCGHDPTKLASDKISDIEKIIEKIKVANEKPILWYDEDKFPEEYKLNDSSSI